MFVIECISFCSSLVLSISLFRILLPLNLLFTQVNPVFFCPFYSIFLLLFFLLQFKNIIILIIYLT